MTERGRMLAPERVTEFYHNEFGNDQAVSFLEFGVSVDLQRCHNGGGVKFLRRASRKR